MTATVSPAGSLLVRSRLVLVVMVAMLVQLGGCSRITVAGVHPDLMVLLPVAAGALGGPERGAVVGFFAGLLDDMFLQTPLGLAALAFCLVGFAVGVVHSGVLRASWWLPAVTAVAASAGGEVLYALIGAIVGQGQLLTDRLAPVAGIVGGLNGILSLVVLPVVAWAGRTEERRPARRSRW